MILCAMQSDTSENIVFLFLGEFVGESFGFVCDFFLDLLVNFFGFDGEIFWDFFWLFKKNLLDLSIYYGFVNKTVLFLI